MDTFCETSSDNVCALYSEKGPLRGRVWHATTLERAILIASENVIRPDATPTYSDGFCRHLGGVSLFDFRQGKIAFDAFNLYGTGWLPDLTQTDIRVWFSIDPARTDVSISSQNILDLWRKSGPRDADRLPLSKTPIANCEGCHKGEIQLANCEYALVIGGGPAPFVRKLQLDASLTESLSAFSRCDTAKLPM
jgi:hypothetical protein